jgi:hypothetical protein
VEAIRDRGDAAWITGNPAGTLDANLVSISGQSVTGNNATLKLKTLDIQNPDLNGFALNLRAPLGAGLGCDLTHIDSLAADTIVTGSLDVAFQSSFGGKITAAHSANNIAGVALASTGLNAIPITAPTGPATTFPQMVVQGWRRFFKKAMMTATETKTYADDGITVITTQALSDDTTTQTQGPAS